VNILIYSFSGVGKLFLKEHLDFDISSVKIFFINYLLSLWTAELAFSLSVLI
jgi:hypothetical protein